MDLHRCLACGHAHDPASAGACYEAACLDGCPECAAEGHAPHTFQPLPAEA